MQYCNRIGLFRDKGLLNPLRASAVYCLATIINYTARGHLLKYIQCKKWNPSNFKLIKFVLFDSFFVVLFILFFIEQGVTYSTQYNCFCL